MAETPTPTTPSPSAASLTQIRAHIPIILDMNKMNYDSWRILFETHCFSFFLTGHIDGSSIPTGLTDTSWKQLDNIVKMWIYGTISESLLTSVLKTQCSATMFEEEYIVSYFNKDLNINELVIDIQACNMNPAVKEKLRDVGILTFNQLMICVADPMGLDSLHLSDEEILHIRQVVPLMIFQYQKVASLFLIECLRQLSKLANEFEDVRQRNSFYTVSDWMLDFMSIWEAINDKGGNHDGAANLYKRFLKECHLKEQVKAYNLICELKQFERQAAAVREQAAAALREQSTLANVETKLNAVLCKMEKEETSKIKKLINDQCMQIKAHMGKSPVLYYHKDQLEKLDLVCNNAFRELKDAFKGIATGKESDVGNTRILKEFDVLHQIKEKMATQSELNSLSKLIIEDLPSGSVIQTLTSAFSAHIKRIKEELEKNQKQSLKKIRTEVQEIKTLLGSEPTVNVESRLSRVTSQIDEIRGYFTGSSLQDEMRKAMKDVESRVLEITSQIDTIHHKFTTMEDNASRKLSKLSSEAKARIEEAIEELENLKAMQIGHNETIGHSIKSLKTMV